MNSKSSVFPRTLETNPYSIGHTDPLRIEYATFETALWDQKGSNITNIGTTTGTNDTHSLLYQFY